MCWPEPDEQNWFSNLEATGWLKHIRVNNIQKKNPMTFILDLLIDLFIRL